MSGGDTNSWRDDQQSCPSPSSEKGPGLKMGTGEAQLSPRELQPRGPPRKDVLRGQTGCGRRLQAQKEAAQPGQNYDSGISHRKEKEAKEHSPRRSKERACGKTPLTA